MVWWSWADLAMSSFSQGGLVAGTQAVELDLTRITKQGEMKHIPTSRPFMEVRKLIFGRKCSIRIGRYVLAHCLWLKVNTKRDVTKRIVTVTTLEIPK